MDTHIHSTYLRIERKQFAFDFKENPQGTFLRIIEEVRSGRRNSIVIPATGLEMFRDALNEVINFDKAHAGSPAMLPLGQPRTDAPAPSDSPK
jgi:PurA-like ssDNA and RNA-binding protein